MRAADREEQPRENMENKQAHPARRRAHPRRARRVATTLDVYAVAKAQSRTAPELLRAFEFLANYFARSPRKPREEPTA
jgi:hypothetical protein